MTPDVSIDEIRMLAKVMALKNAAAGLKFGGAKSGIKIDPQGPEAETQYRRFVSLSKPFLHENGGVFGGFGFDIGARPEMPYWACDELGSTNSFTGKPVEMGGTDYDKEGIAGLGVAVAAKALLAHERADVEGQRFALQGLGAMGAAVLRYFCEMGGVLAALGDPKYGGSWRFENGISDKLRDALVEQDVGTATALIQAEGAQFSDTAEDVLYEEVDTLFPCAVQDVVTKDNMARVSAKRIVEGANQPLTQDAYVYFQEKGVRVIPDFIANPGGVIAAYVELTSDITAEENAKSGAKVKEAKDYTITKISANVAQVLNLADEHSVMPVQAGMYVALSRVFGEDI